MFVYKNGKLNNISISKNRRNDNHSVILFTNARDENNMAEWVAHHLLLGFDKIVVFDHLSVVLISNSLNNNFDGKLDIIRVNDNTTSIKLSLMERAVTIAQQKNYSWMLYLDADEYINLNCAENNIKLFLNGFKEADAIGINWLMFGTSGHKTQPKGLLTEHFIRSNIRLDKHVKSFVRPTTVIRVDSPHYYTIINKNRYYSGNGTKMFPSPFNIQPVPFVKSRIYIAHYYTQSEEEHLRRKSRVLDDGTVNKSNGIKEIHKLYNEVTNNQLQNKYSNKIRKFLLEYNIY